MAYSSSNQPMLPPDPYNDPYNSYPPAPLLVRSTTFTRLAEIFKIAIIAGVVQASSPVLQLLGSSLLHVLPAGFGWVALSHFSLNLIDLFITGVVAFCTGFFVARKTGRIGSGLVACLVANVPYTLVIVSMTVIIDPLLLGASFADIGPYFLPILMREIAFVVILTAAVSILLGSLGGLAGRERAQVSPFLPGSGPGVPGQAYPPFYGQYPPQQPSYGSYDPSLPPAYPLQAHAQRQPTSFRRRSFSRFQIRLISLGIFVCFLGFYGMVSGGSHNPATLLAMLGLSGGGALLCILVLLARSRR